MKLAQQRRRARERRRRIDPAARRAQLLCELAELDAK
jgi:hypothetical protein